MGPILNLRWRDTWIGTHILNMIFTAMIQETVSQPETYCTVQKLLE